MKTLIIGDVKVGHGAPLVLVSGPCVIESEEITLYTARAIKEIARRLGVGFIFKSSYDKGNRSSVDYYRGPGLEKGLKILEKVKKEVGVPVISDIHCRTEIPAASRVLDILQIPAYLCQQTDLVVEAAGTGLPLNIKKGQFIAPYDMKKIVSKAASVGNDKIILTERGTVFGYNNLVCDFRSIPIMREETGCPVLADVTHMIRMPGPSSKDASGGQPQFIPTLSYAASAAGVDGLFLEVHPKPREALCDAASMLALEKLEEVVRKSLAVSKVVRPS